MQYQCSLCNSGGSSLCVENPQVRDSLTTFLAHHENGVTVLREMGGITSQSTPVED